MNTKKKNKYFIVGLLSLCLLLGGTFLGFGVGSKTAYADTPLSAFRFTQISSAGYSVAAVDKTMTYAEIPSEYNGLPIIEIAANGFASCANLETVRIPESVKKIGIGAFMNCAKLKDIPMAAPEIIGQNAFALCRGLKTLVLPNTVTSVGANILLSAGTETILLKAISGSCKYLDWLA